MLLPSSAAFSTASRAGITASPTLFFTDSINFLVLGPMGWSRFSFSRILSTASFPPLSISVVSGRSGRAISYIQNNCCCWLANLSKNTTLDPFIVLRFFPNQSQEKSFWRCGANRRPIATTNLRKVHLLLPLTPLRLALSALRRPLLCGCKQDQKSRIQFP